MIDLKKIPLLRIRLRPVQACASFSCGLQLHCTATSFILMSFNTLKLSRGYIRLQKNERLHKRRGESASWITQTSNYWYWAFASPSTTARFSFFAWHFSFALSARRYFAFFIVVFAGKETCSFSRCFEQYLTKSTSLNCNFSNKAQFHSFIQ